MEEDLSSSMEVTPDPQLLPLSIDLEEQSEVAREEMKGDLAASKKMLSTRSFIAAAPDLNEISFAQRESFFPPNALLKMAIASHGETHEHDHSSVCGARRIRRAVNRPPARFVQTARWAEVKESPWPPPALSAALPRPAAASR